MPELCPSRTVADYFLATSDEASGEGISPLKIQKLVYYAQGLSLGMSNEPLFDEPIEAWTYGPVVSSLYHAFKHHGNESIDRPDNFSIDDYTPEVREILEAVAIVYGQFAAWKLRDMTHSEPPWRDTPRNCEISRLAIRDFFYQVVEAGREGLHLPGEPVWPTASFQHQRRLQISDRMDRHREKLRAIAKLRPIGGDPWADDVE